MITIRIRDRQTIARVLKTTATRSVSRRDAGQLVEVVSEKALESLGD